MAAPGNYPCPVPVEHFEDRSNESQTGQDLLVGSWGVAVGIWLWVAYVLNAIRCDDGCSGSEGQAWGWTAAWVVALLGCGIGLLGVIIHFLMSGRLGMRLVGMSVACAAIWLIFAIGLVG